MKNVFKKAVSLTVALSTVAALSVSAFAATAEYNKTDVAVEVSDYATTADGQYAVAVVPADFTGSEENADSLIYYVNQADQTAIVGIVESMLVKGALADGDYEVRIGNNAGVDLEVIPFTVTSVQTPTTTTVTFTFGDMDGADGVTPFDAAYISAYLNGGSASVGGKYNIGAVIVDANSATYTFGDMDGADGVTPFDAAYISAYLNGGSASVGGAANIGTDLTLTVPAE